MAMGGNYPIAGWCKFHGKSHLEMDDLAVSQFQEITISRPHLGCCSQLRLGKAHLGLPGVTGLEDFDREIPVEIHVSMVESLKINEDQSSPMSYVKLPEDIGVIHFSLWD